MDEDYLVVRLVRVDPTSYAFIHISTKCHNNSHWATRIHNERPITPKYATEIIDNLQ